MGIEKLEYFKKSEIKLVSKNTDIKKILSLDRLSKIYNSEKVKEVHYYYTINSELSENYGQGSFSPETELEAITKTNRYFSIYGNYKK